MLSASLLVFDWILDLSDGKLRIRNIFDIERQLQIRKIFSLFAEFSRNFKVVVLLINQFTIKLLELRKTVHIHIFTKKSFFLKHNSPKIFNFCWRMFFKISFNFQALRLIQFLINFCSKRNCRYLLVNGLFQQFIFILYFVYFLVHQFVEFDFLIFE